MGIIHFFLYDSLYDTPPAKDSPVGINGGPKLQPNEAADATFGLSHATETAQLMHSDDQLQGNGDQV
jgi:hypothetical protein